MKLNTSKNFLIGLTVASLLGACNKVVDNSATFKEQVTGQLINSPKTLKDFVEVNIVGDNNDFTPARIDSGLINAWGIAFSPTGSTWVTAMASGLSGVYNNDGSSARPNVTIPSHGSATGGHPTGVVFNSSADFKLPNGNPARFIFAQVDGIISGWNGGNAAINMAEDAGQLYTGITIASDNGANFLYVANFSAGKIEVYDKNWIEVNKPFIDTDIPAGYSPFNIENIEGKLYVMYAKNGINPGEVVNTNPGTGFIDIFNPDGSFVSRFATTGQLNAPWGITKAPAGFWGNETDTQDIILVGNFGDGHINAYSSDGVFQGQLRAHGNPIVIEGLWAISFAPANLTLFNHNQLYFAAGPGGEKHGIFGVIHK